ncbi:MAG TPA: hypothetical protein VK689_23125, partial [Armatimonadota bacterium]|nr:hypothetical protein [Armatimonadota bacterium]
PASPAAWATQRDDWLKALREKSFGGWPEKAAPLDLKPAFSVERHGIRFSAYDFTSQEAIRLRLYIAHRAGLERPDLTVVNVLDEEGWTRWLAGVRAGFAEELHDERAVEPDPKALAETAAMLKSFKWAMAYVAPRGIGPTAWDDQGQKGVHIRRRFMLLGQTLDGMRVWDVRRALEAVRSLKALGRAPLWLQGERGMAGVALYASLFEPDVARLDLWELSPSHRQGPDLLNVLKWMDVPQAVAMAAERSKVRIYQHGKSGWEYPAAVAAALGWDPKQIEIRAAAPSPAQR